MSAPMTPLDKAVALRDHDEHEEEALEDEVVAGEDEGARPEIRVAPEEGDPLFDLRAERRGVALARFLERRPHPEQRQNREGVREAVSEEGQSAPGLEQRTAERRPGERHDREARLLGRGGVGQLARRHDRAQRADLGDVEEDKRSAFDERSDYDLRERQVAE